LVGLNDRFEAFVEANRASQLRKISIVATLLPSIPTNRLTPLMQQCVSQVKTTIMQLQGTEKALKKTASTPIHTPAAPQQKVRSASSPPAPHTEASPSTQAKARSDSMPVTAADLATIEDKRSKKIHHTFAEVIQVQKNYVERYDTNVQAFWGLEKKLDSQGKKDPVLSQFVMSLHKLNYDSKLVMKELERIDEMPNAEKQEETMKLFNSPTFEKYMRSLGASLALSTKIGNTKIKSYVEDMKKNAVSIPGGATFYEKFDTIYQPTLFFQNLGKYPLLAREMNNLKSSEQADLPNRPAEILKDINDNVLKKTP
jgi:hypothetical protein